MKKLISISLAAIIAMLILPFAASASIGVGVGTGKIQVDKPFMPGQIYTVPSILVVNTGTEPSEYTVSIDYPGGQTQLKPDSKWFTFEPLQFALQPNQSQKVQIKMTLPVNTAPGDYFAYLEAHPVSKTAASGSTTIGVAAAVKFYFTVAPANIFQGMYYRFIYFYSLYSPWDTVILAILAAAVLVLVFKRYFNIQIGVKKKIS
jgi:P pilus assembly chaperone PapD